MGDRYSTQRAIPVLTRAMRTQIVPHVDRLYLYPIRIYDGRPEEGGKLIREEMPSLELPKGWLDNFQINPGYEDFICIGCGKEFERRTGTKNKVRCDPCQVIHKKAYNSEYNKRIYAERKAAKCA